MPGMIRAGELDRRVTILRRQATQSATSGAEDITWEPLATVWARVRDVLPSRGEQTENQVEIAKRRSQVWMRWRGDIDQSMRLSVDGRELQIVSGPAELGRRECIELMAEHISTQGDGL